MLEWTGKLVPQGLLVKGIPGLQLVCFHMRLQVCMAYNSVSVFSAGVKNGWRFAWQTMMKELAPQTADGSYSRPSYDFQARIGDSNFPVSHCRHDSLKLMASMPPCMSAAGRVRSVSHLHWQCLPVVSSCLASTHCKGSHPAYQCDLGS